MSDRFESIFDGLRGQRPPAAFAPTEAIRRRGRQRARRQVALAGIAALAVTGVGAGAVAASVGGPGPQPPVGGPATETPVTTPPTSPPRPPAEVPDRWLLTATDLGDGQWQTGAWEPEWTEGPDRWRWEGACPGYRSEDYPSLPERVDQRTVAWTDGPFGESDIPRWVHQIVDVFADSAAAADNLDDTRTVLALCETGDPVPPRSYEVLDTGFAGDEAMLLRERTDVEGGPVDSYTVVVRVANVVATVHGYDPALGHADPDFLRQVAERAADRVS